jgi:ribosomal protein L7/L12
VALIQAGNKLEAIRLVREQLKVDLKGAKDLVDAYHEPMT